jgi:hypothetical protein
LAFWQANDAMHELEQRHLNGRFTVTYRHHLVRISAGWRIQFQRVALLNYDGPYDDVLQSWV